MPRRFKRKLAALLRAAATPTNYASGTLTGGTWNVFGNSTLRVPLGSGILTNAANILLDGVNSNFYNGTSGTTNALAPLATIAAAGSLTVQDGRTLTTIGQFTNSGSLLVDTGSSFTTNGSYIQTAGATNLNGGTLASPTSVAISVESNASTLAASLSDPSTLDAGDATGLAFVPALVGSYGTYTPVPPGAPANTSVINIPPGNGQSGFFETTFTLPDTFSNISLAGAANADDMGRVFLNGTPISPSLFSSSPGKITEYGNATFATSDSSLFLPGENTILVADDNTGGPSGAAFFADVTYTDTTDATVAVQGGSLTGSGTVIGNVSNAGAVGPGQSPGTLNINGNYAQSAGGIFDVEIGGPAAGQFNQINASGSATLAGALDVSLVNGYQPAQGASTSFLSANAVSGAFSNVINTTPGSAYSFSADYSTPNAVRVVVTSVPFVDLVVTQVQGPSQLVAGLPGTATWTVTNQGNTATTIAWDDAVYLSTDGQVSGATLLAAQAEGSTPLGGNGSYQASASFTLPVGTAAETYSLVVDTNYQQTQTESTYSNNTRAVAVAVLPPQPDLVVTGLAVSPASPQSGGSLTVNWDDSNTGLGAVSNSFSDEVQIVNTTTAQTLATAAVLYNETSRGPLAANGGSAAQQYTLQLPNGAAGVGQWQITVTNDIYDQVTKFNANGTPEASSTATLATTSSLAPYPDLHATGVAVDPSSVLRSSGTVTVDWNDSNVGDGTASGSWYDQIQVVNTTTG